MFCSRCGCQVSENSKFCPRCGNGLGGTPAPAPQGARQAPPQDAPGAYATQGAYAPATHKGPSKGLVVGLAVVVVAVVAAIVLGLVTCVGGSHGDGVSVDTERSESVTSYVGAWEGTAEYSGLTIDCTLTLNEDGTAEIEGYARGESNSMDSLRWRETDDGVKVASQGEEDWIEFELDGDTLSADEGGVTFELTRQ